MMRINLAEKLASARPLTRWWLIVAQILVLIALTLGFPFLLHTTGGTLFLFSSLAPLLVFVSIAIVLWVAIDTFRKRHSLFSLESYESDQVIIRQGEPGDYAYFIQSGEVEVVQETDGEQVVLRTLHAGDYFGEMALLSGQPRTASVRALTPTKVAVLGKQNFLTMLQMIPSTRKDILTTVQERAMRSARLSEGSSKSSVR